MRPSIHGVRFFVFLFLSYEPLYNCLTSEPFLFRKVTVIRLSVCFIPAERKNSHLSMAVYVIGQEMREYEDARDGPVHREPVSVLCAPLTHYAERSGIERLL